MVCSLHILLTHFLRTANTHTHTYTHTHAHTRIYTYAYLNMNNFIGTTKPEMTLYNAAIDDFDPRMEASRLTGVCVCVAGCCSVLQGVAGCGRVLQGVAGCCRVLQGAAGL